MRFKAGNKGQTFMGQKEFIDQEKIDNRFKGFIGHYSTPERRHLAAMQIATFADARFKDAPPKDASLPEQNHPDRNLLLAHWGDTTDELKQAASFLYRLKAQIKNRVGQPVMVFQRGDYNALTEEMGEAYIKFAYGTVATNELDHRYHSRLVPFAKKGVDVQGNETISYHNYERDGLTNPYLAFQAGIPVKNAFEVEIDLVAPPKVTQLERTVLPVLDGIVSLKPDEKSYRRSRRSELLSSMFGAEPPEAVMEQVHMLGELAVTS